MPAKADVEPMRMALREKEFERVKPKGARNMGKEELGVREKRRLGIKKAFAGARLLRIQFMPTPTKQITRNSEFPLT